MSLTPPIGASGIFTLDSPFDTTLQASATYTCVAVRRLSEIIKNGIDPFLKYYVPKNIDQTKYNTDVKNNECIVTLRSTGGDWAYIPTSYIKSYPNMNGIAYHSCVLAISLGALPTYLDLSELKTSMINLVRDKIGITSDVKTVVVSKETKLSIADSTALETARQNNITDSTTDSAKVIALTNENASLRQQISALESYIAQNIP